VLVLEMAMMAAVRNLTVDEQSQRGERGRVVKEVRTMRQGG
jgi:hypothetical protein